VKDAKRQTLGLVTLLAILTSALPLGANRPMWWLLLAFVIFVLFTVQLYLDFRQGPDVASRRALLPALLFIAAVGWACVQAGLPVDESLAHPVWKVVFTMSSFRISADPIETLHHIVRLACYAMIFWIALRAARNSRFADISLQIIAVVITGFSAYGILAVILGGNPILGDLASRAVSASFVNRNNFASFAVVGLLANTTIYLRHRPAASSDGLRQARDFLEAFFSGSWIFAIGILICFAAIFFSESRAGLGAALIGLAVFSATGRDRGAGSAFSVAFVALIVALSIIAFSSGTFTRIFAVQGEEARFLIYPLVLDGIGDRPWLGHGLGAFHDAFRPYVTPELSFREIDLAHSSYLENIFELGIPAAAVFYSALFLIVGGIYRGLRVRRRNKHFARFAFAVTVALGFHAFLDFSLQIPAIASLFAFVLGLGWAQAFSEKDFKENLGSASE